MTTQKRDIGKASALMERIIHLYVQAEKKPRYYGTEHLLTRPEIHTINAIGDNPDINVTDLSKLQGVTKGASSQMIYKLVKKGFVTKNTSPNSDSEVVLGLTQQGKIAYEAHKAYHIESNEAFFLLLKDMPDDAYNKMIELLESFESMLEKSTNH